MKQSMVRGIPYVKPRNTSNNLQQQKHLQLTKEHGRYVIMDAADMKHYACSSSGTVHLPLLLKF